LERVTVSPAVFEYLVRHLVEVEEGRNHLLEQYFLEPSKERYDFESLIDTYVMHIDSLIKRANKSRDADSKVPCVTIESEVTVQDLSDGETHVYRIVSPFNGKVKPERGIISYLSPIGRVLLLKKIGDEVKIHAPGGVIRYKILSIRMPEAPKNAC